MFEKLFRSNFVKSSSVIVTNFLKSFNLTHTRLDQVFSFMTRQRIAVSLQKCDLLTVKQRKFLSPVFMNFNSNPFRDCVLSCRVGYGLPIASFSQNIQTRGVHMLVVRREKMKKHKRRKLLKRLKFFRLKKRQRHLYKREKAFQATLINQVKEADNFNADQYVDERIEKLLKLRELSLKNVSSPYSD